MKKININDAKRILSHPREQFAALDGAEKATELLKLWDTMAEQFPELVEGGPGWLWAGLKTEGEPVQCRYKQEDGIWLWDAGADDPDMSISLRAKWENGPGDALLTQLQQTEKTQFLQA